jgi:hypothetical protein
MISRPSNDDAERKVYDCDYHNNSVRTRDLIVKRIAMLIVKCGGFGSSDEDVKSQKASGSKTRKKHTEEPFWGKVRMTWAESC